MLLLLIDRGTVPNMKMKRLQWNLSSLLKFLTPLFDVTVAIRIANLLTFVFLMVVLSVPMGSRFM